MSASAFKTTMAAIALALVGVLAVLGVLAGLERQKIAHRQQIALRNVESLVRAHGGSLSGPSQRGEVVVHLSGTTTSDQDLRVMAPQFAELPGLATLLLRGTRVTDAGLEYLRPLTSLQHLVLIDTKVTESGVRTLAPALPHATIAFGPTANRQTWPPAAPPKP
jgi:hypothetical protein